MIHTGLCFDLRSWYIHQGFSSEDTAEFDKEETIDAIDSALVSLGFETERIGNVFQLVDALAAGKRWNLVFNICEGLYGPARESAVPALLDQYRIPYVFSNAEVLGISLNKQLAKQVVSSHGVPVADGKVIRHLHELEELALEFPLFVKPLAEGTGKGITGKSKAEDFSALKTSVEFLLNRFRQPVLVEEFLPGREFTAGIVGNGDSARIVGAMEITVTSNDIYSLYVKENYHEFVRYSPADRETLEECSLISLKAWKALGAADGGRIDLRVDRKGQMCFMEANPLAGLHPVHSDLPMAARMNGISYQRLIGMIMESALQRLNIEQ